MSEQTERLAGLRAAEDWMAAHDPELLTMYLRAANDIPREEIAAVHERICVEVMFSGTFDHFTLRQAAMFIPRRLVEVLRTRR